VSGNLPESIVCWKWRPPSGYRSAYAPATVNTLRAMVARHFPHPHRFICVTDDPTGIDPRVEIVPLWNDFADVPSPHGKKNPSCYRRLRAFHPDIASVFGRRFVSLDLDCVVTGDLTPLWDRPEAFVAYGDTGPKSFYNGSMFMLTAGARPQVWERFDPRTSPDASVRAGFWGSDQGWMALCLGTGEARWSKRDGVYSYRNEIQPRRHSLPEDARIVIFHGRLDPWTSEAGQMSWVREHYREAA
jgi:hypothetical protein